MYLLRLEKIPWFQTKPMQALADTKPLYEKRIRELLEEAFRPPVTTR